MLRYYKMKPRRKQRLNPDTVVLLKRIFTGFLVLTFVALLITVVWYGTRIPALTITEIQISGGKTIKHSDVETITKQELEGTYLGIIPRRFAWFYPEENIHSSLESIERIHGISINRTSGTVLSVVFDEYTPQALWCESIKSEECLFLDDVGYAFAKAPKLSGGSFLRFVRTDEPTVLNQSFTSAESFDSLLTLAKLLAEHGWFVSHFELDQVGDAFISLVDGGEIKVVISQSPIKTMDNLFVILSSPKFEHLAPGNFQYIDLRFGNKVFVNEELIVSEEEVDNENASTTIDIEEVE